MEANAKLQKSIDRSKEEFQHMFKELNKFVVEIARKVSSQAQSTVMTKGGREGVLGKSEIERNFRNDRSVVISDDIQDDDNYLDNPSYANSYLN